MTSRRFTQDDISQEQAETFNEVITRVAVLSDEWKALQVWTRLDWVIRSPEGRGRIPGIQECGRFDRGSSQRPRGGRQLFTSQDDAEFMIMEGSSAALFNHFITNNNE